MFLENKIKGTLLVCLACFLIGCADNPGTWGKDKVAAKIAEELELTDVNITPMEGGGFEGTGKRADGETMKFKITQDPEAHKMSWTSEGDRGSYLDGSYALQ